MDKYLRSCTRKYTFYGGEKHIGLLMVWENVKDSYQAYSRILEELDMLRKRSANDMFNVTLGISDMHADIGDLHLCYREAYKALKAKSYMGSGTLIPHGGLQKKKGKKYYPVSRESLEDAMTAGDREQLDAFMAGHFNRYKNSGAAADCLAFIAYDIVCALEEITEGEDLTGSPASISISDFVRRLPGILTLDALYDEIIRLCMSYADSIAFSREARTDSLVGEVRDYIRNNYMKDINLKTLAANLYVSHSHLGRIFFTKTGVPFIDYLTDYRIKRAKELLANTERSLYSISRMVGYESEKYFSALFRKREGVSPQEYRTAHQGNCPNDL